MKVKITTLVEVGKDNTFKVLSTTSEVLEEIETSTKPLLILQDNKYELNSAAIELLNATYGDRLNIEYSQIDGFMYPVICKSEDAGNKLTKSKTVSYRGTANEVLSKYGTEFTIEYYDGTIFKLISKAIEPIIVEDENIELPNADEEIDIDEKESSDELDDWLAEFDKSTELKDINFESLIN